MNISKKSWHYKLYKKFYRPSSKEDLDICNYSIGLFNALFYYGMVTILILVFSSLVSAEIGSSCYKEISLYTGDFLTLPTSPSDKTLLEILITSPRTFFLLSFLGLLVIGSLVVIFCLIFFLAFIIPDFFALQYARLHKKAKSYGYCQKINLKD